MLQRIRMSAGIVAIVIIMALAVALPRLVATSRSSAAATPLTMSLVCQVQPACVFDAGTTGIDVDVVMTNNSAGPISVASFNFEVYNSNRAFLTPSVPTSAGPIAAGFNCSNGSLPSADIGGYVPGVTSSAVSCFNASGAIALPPAGTTTLATVHFAAAGPDSVDLMLTNAAASDPDAVILLSCDPADGPPAPPIGAGLAPCSPATVIVGQGGLTSTPTTIPTATNTPTPAAPTPTPCGGGACSTPVGVPTGAPSEVLLLNSSNCVPLSLVFAGLPTLAALSDCLGIGVQGGPTDQTNPGNIQHLVSCLRGTVVDGRHECAFSSPITQVVPGDFTNIDRDRDQAHDGQDLIVLSFVTADYPVAFETDAGAFLSQSSVILGQSYTCFNGSPFFEPGTGEPDCDGLPDTAGDGLVVARLHVDATTPRGTHHLTVTQGGTSIVKEFHVVGLPTSITFTTLAGKTSIETGATAFLGIGTEVLRTDCVFNLANVLTGLPGRPEKAVVFTKALDSDGNEVVGSLLEWDRGFIASVDGSVGAPSQSGVVLPLTPTLDFGEIGIGFPQVICGGTDTGLLTEDVHITNILDQFADPSIHATYSIDVVAPAPPTATATATSTSAPTSTSTAIPTATNTQPPTTPTSLTFVTITPNAGTRTAVALTPTPTGTLSEALLLNSSNCIALSIAFGGLGAIEAVSDCGGIGLQGGPTDQTNPGNIQHLVSCLRGAVIDGLHQCVFAPVGQVVPGDFTTIDRDRDQAHDGQDLIVLSFVTADYPVAFETDAGTLVSMSGGGDLGQAYTCFSGSAIDPPYTGDPDCDGSADTAGDGVVVARLRVDATTPRGTHHLTVTQGGTSIVREFHVVGIPASISFTTLAGKASIETGATAPANGTLDPLATDCVFGLADVLTGLPDRPEKAVVLAKALDSDGNEVVGTILQWNHTFVAPASGTTGPLPQGGVALPQTPTFDFGEAGIGFPQVICGGTDAGLLTEDVHISNILDRAADTSIHAAYAIEVVAPPTPTATFTATSTSTHTPTSTPTATPPPAHRGGGGGGSRATATAVPKTAVATATSTPVNEVLPIAATPRPRPRILLPDTGLGPAGPDRLWSVLPAMIAAGALLLAAAGVLLRKRHTRMG